MAAWPAVRTLCAQHRCTGSSGNAVGRAASRPEPRSGHLARRQAADGAGENHPVDVAHPAGRRGPPWPWRHRVAGRLTAISRTYSPAQSDPFPAAQTIGTVVQGGLADGVGGSGHLPKARAPHEAIEQSGNGQPLIRTLGTISAHFMACSGGRQPLCWFREANCGNGLANGWAAERLKAPVLKTDPLPSIYVTTAPVETAGYLPVCSAREHFRGFQGIRSDQPISGHLTPSHRVGWQFGWQAGCRPRGCRRSAFQRRTRPVRRWDRGGRPAARRA
jgi:hypothetical protein